MTRPHFSHPHKPEDLFRMFRSKLSIDENAALGSLHDDNQRAIEDAINGFPTEDGGILVAVANEATQGLPAIIYTTNGNTWRPANEPARFEVPGGPNDTVGVGVWTGPGGRFLTFIQSSTGPHACLLQSLDGINWDWHPDNTSFPTAALILGLAANSQGLVLASTDAPAVFLSTDFGATWAPSGVGALSAPFVAAAGTTLVAGGGTCAAGTSKVSTDSGATWGSVVFDATMLGAVFNHVLSIQFADGWWWWLIGDATAGFLWKTQDFQTWTRVISGLDRDFPPAVAYNSGPVTPGNSLSLFVGGDDLRSLLLCYDRDGFSSYGKFTISQDGGTTWKIISNTADVAFFAGSALEGVVIGTLFPQQTNIVMWYGAAWAFDQIWVTNSEGPSNAGDTPPMVVGTSDLTAWYGPTLPWELVGDLGYSIGVGQGYGPIMLGFPAG